MVVGVITDVMWVEGMMWDGVKVSEYSLIWLLIIFILKLINID